jgi:hypothetical protein
MNLLKVVGKLLMDFHHHSPFMLLSHIIEFSTYMHIEMNENFTAVLIPNYMWARITFCNTEESNFVTENIFIVEMTCEGNFSALCKLYKNKPTEA